MLCQNVLDQFYSFKSLLVYQFQRDRKLWDTLYLDLLTKQLFPFNRLLPMAIICFLIQQDGARISSHYNRTTVGRNCSKLRRTLVSLQQCTRNTTGKRPAINVSLTQIPAVLQSCVFIFSLSFILLLLCLRFELHPLYITFIYEYI